MNTSSAVSETQIERALKDLWLSKVDGAYMQYLRAEERYRHMVEELGHVADSKYNDGFYATARARRAASTAFAEYERLKAIYHDFLLAGKVPPPDDDQTPFY
jgi:hypothetical protein